MEKVTLKLVGAQTYVGPRTKETILRKGDTYNFDAKDAEEALKLTNRDALGNDHKLFVVVQQPRLAQEGDEREAKGAQTSKAPARQRVTRRKAAPQTDAGEEGEGEGGED